jgi:hypothetical protein
MPKIPTFQARGTITTEAPSVRTGLQLSPTATPAAALVKPVTQIAEYYERERMIAEKAEADKQYLELSTELDQIQDQSSKQFNPSEAQKIFKTQSSFLFNQKLNQIENKRIKKIMQDKFNYDLVRRNYKVAQLSRNELDKQTAYNFETNFQLNLSKYRTAKDEQEKLFYRNEMFSDLDSKATHFGDAPSTKQLDLDNLENNLFKIDFQTTLDENNFNKSLEMISTLNDKKFLTDNDREKLKKDFAEASKITLIADGMLNNMGIHLSDKEKTDGLNYLVSSGNITQGNQIAEIAINNNGVFKPHKNVLQAGFTNAAITGNIKVVQSAYDIYKNYKSQGADAYLKGGMKLTQDEIDFYDALDFMIDNMGATFENAVSDYQRYYKNKNTQDVKKLIIDSKKITSVSKDIANSFFAKDAVNLDEIESLVMRQSNLLYKIRRGDQDQILESVKNNIERDYRVDIFGMLVPRKQNRPDYHDISIKTYIKSLHDQGKINPFNEIDDLIAVDADAFGISDVNGIYIINKTNGMQVPILNTDEDTDSIEFNRGLITDKHLKEQVYPLMKDVRYQDFINKYKNRKEVWQMLEQETDISLTP